MYCGTLNSAEQPFGASNDDHSDQDDHQGLELRAIAANANAAAKSTRRGLLLAIELGIFSLSALSTRTPSQATTRPAACLRP